MTHVKKDSKGQVTLQITQNARKVLKQNEIKLKPRTGTSAQMQYYAGTEPITKKPTPSSYNQRSGSGVTIYRGPQSREMIDS